MVSMAVGVEGVHGIQPHLPHNLNITIHRFQHRINQNCLFGCLAPEYIRVGEGGVLEQLKLCLFITCNNTLKQYMKGGKPNGDYQTQWFEFLHARKGWYIFLMQTHFDYFLRYRYCYNLFSKKISLYYTVLSRK